MNQRVNTFCAVGLLALATSCAGSYAPIRPKRFTSYLASPSSGPVSFAYQFDALRLGGPNKKYVKKEMKNGYHVLAVRVTNNWDREINFSRDLTLFYGDRPVTPVPATIAAHDLRQGVAIYLLYLLGNMQVGGTTDVRTGVTSGSTFLPTGLLLAGGNMLGAGTANSNLRKEFEAYDLTNRSIKPGETVYGIMSLREIAVAPLRVEFRASTPPTAPAATLPVPAETPTATPAPAPH